VADAMFRWPKASGNLVSMTPLSSADHHAFFISLSTTPMALPKK
jgi:hypothetical protein